VKPVLAKVAPESLMAVGYAAFVALGAIAFETSARHSQRGHQPADLEAGRLRRAVEVAMVGFGGLVLMATAALHHTGADLAVLAGGYTICVLTAVFLIADLRPAMPVVRWPEGQERPRAPTT
jgi:thiamine monophosphate synthase